MTIYIEIEDNPNCEAMDGQVFQPRSTPRPVAQVRAERQWRRALVQRHWPGPRLDAVPRSGDLSSTIPVMAPAI